MRADLFAFETQTTSHVFVVAAPVKCENHCLDKQRNWTIDECDMLWVLGQECRIEIERS